MPSQRQTDTRTPTAAPPARPAAGPVRESDTGQLQGAVADPAHASAGALLALQGRYGNRAVTHLIARSSTPVIQAKLTVGAADDAYEREADQVAEQVMRFSAGSAAPLSAGIQQPGDDQLHRQALVQRKPNKPQAVVKLRGGPQVQLGRKNRKNRNNRNKSTRTQSSTQLMIAPPPEKLMIGDGREKMTPPKSSKTEQPTTPTEETSESPTEGSTESTPVSSPTVDRIGSGMDMLNDIVDIKDAIGEYQKSGSTTETVGAIAKGGGKSISAVQNLSIATGLVEKDSPSLFYSTAISQGAAIIAAGAETYKAFNELRDNWGAWTLSQLWENKSRVGAVIEKAMDIVKGVADIAKSFFERFKELEIPLLDKIKQAAVIVQKVQSFWSAWTRFAKIKAAGANVTRVDKKEVVDHLINLTWDQMKQSALEILTAGINLVGAFSKGTGVGMVYGYLIELGGKIAEGGGKAYVSGLRSLRETSYTPGWLFDKNKTTEKRKQIALKINQLKLTYLYEAAGLDPGPPRPPLDKIEEALAQPN